MGSDRMSWLGGACLTLPPPGAPVCDWLKSHARRKGFLLSSRFAKRTPKAGCKPALRTADSSGACQMRHQTTTPEITFPKF